MEVHQHTHSDRQKWTHYLWEFLMLFLAVFCGFLAENLREHQVEHQRERQFMISMLDDLRSDTTLLADASYYWNTINTGIDSLAASIQFPVNDNITANSYRYINRAVDYFSFSYNDRTVSQLKNSGGFRLVRNEKVANKIILYDQFNNDAMKNIAELHTFFYKTMMQLANKVFVQEVINQLHDRYDLTPAGADQRGWIDSLLQKNKNPLPSNDYNTLLFEFKNALLAYRKDYSNMKFGYETLRSQMVELITLIQSEYHLK